jgi:hypothetical protein
MRLFKFKNNSKYPIVVLWSIGEIGYFNASNTYPPDSYYTKYWSWLTNTTDNVMGTTLGPGSKKGRGTFVLCSLDAGKDINVIIPLIETNYASNLKNTMSMGISGLEISIIYNTFSNDTMDKNVPKFSMLSKNTSRIEMTLQNDKQNNIVQDVYNLSGIPSGTCSGHINSKASNYKDKNSLNFNASICISNNFSYNYANKKYYPGDINNKTVVDGEPKRDQFIDAMKTSERNTSYLGADICGFPQAFSEKVIDYCNSSLSLNVNRGEPGDKWETSNNKDDIIDCAISTAYLCGIEQFMSSQSNYDKTCPIGINFDIQMKSGENILRKMFAPDEGGYVNQMKWNISEYIKNEHWDSYAYPFQEEIKNPLAERKLTKETDDSENAYLITDLVTCNIMDNEKKIKTIINNNIKKKSGKGYVVFEIDIYDLGSNIKKGVTTSRTTPRNCL